MAIAKLVGKALVLFITTFVLLAIPWQPVRTAYAKAYQATGNAVFATFGESGRVEFKPVEKEGKKGDTAIKLHNRRTGAFGYIYTNSRFMGYVPTALLISLIVATPVPWRQRGRALILGFVAVNAFVLFRLALALLQNFTSASEIGMYRPGPFWSTVLGAAYALFVVTAAGAFVVPVLIWALVTFRRADWRRIFKTLEPSTK
jgi:hypothetical protein